MSLLCVPLMSVGFCMEYIVTLGQTCHLHGGGGGLVKHEA